VHQHGKRVAVGMITTGTPAKKRRPLKVQFVKLPGYWIEQLERSSSPGTFKLAHRILKEDFKRQFGGGEIILSTEATGLSRKVRSKAVKELVELGLIETEQTGNQAVKVTHINIDRKEEKKE
jgi:hypothetical protein